MWPVPRGGREPWRDQWLRHPAPTAFEPAKDICWLTRRADEDPDAENPAAEHGLAFASLHRPSVPRPAEREEETTLGGGA